MRIKVTHHGEDTVEAMIVHRGKDLRRHRLPALRGCSQTEAAARVTKFLQDINASIQRALDLEPGAEPKIDDDAG